MVKKSSNTVIRYLFSEKLGTGGYFTRSIVKNAEDGKEKIVKEDVVSGLGKKDQNESALIVGLGGGAMNNYFSTLENQPYVTIVDIDPTIYYIARRWYDSKPSKYQEFFVDDAIAFVKNRSLNLLSSKNPDELLYDVILIDCSATEATDDLVSPIVEFLDPKVLEDCKKF
uniref:Uncharacterized protein n=1 Tax=Panagrolaimus superbus TaxID=310955 RepID=A0A914Z574_9BILA